MAGGQLPARRSRCLTQRQHALEGLFFLLAQRRVNMPLLCSPELALPPLRSATTGYFLQEFYSLPNYPGYSANPVEAFSSVPPEGLAQIVIFMGWLEVTANKGKYTMMNMFEDGRAPGDLGFDPLKFGDNKETRARLEMAELKNGRLAMLAFSGMIHQTFVTGKPLFASLQEIFAAP